MYGPTKMESLLNTSTISIGLCLALRIFSVFGEIAVFSIPLPGELKNKVTCISEDDGGALVWNYDLQCGRNCSEEIGTNTTEFKNSPRSEGHPIDCPLNDLNGCASNWSMNDGDWQITRSFDKAMGPVLDKRWEDFDEIIVNSNTWIRVGQLTQNDAVVLSARGFTVAYLLLCPTNGTTDCEQTIINNQIENSHPKSTDWHTYTLESSEQTGVVWLWEKFKGYLVSFFQKPMQPNLELFVHSEYGALFRFHSYNYLYTTKADARLHSPEWNHETRASFCTEMSVGLCRDCRLVINVLDKAGKVIHATSINEVQQSPAEHDLPTWQFVKLKTNLHSELRNPFRLEMVTSLRKKRRNTQKPLWAVASVRECSSAEAVRLSAITAVKLEKTPGQFYWPNITCQKFSYNGSSIVQPYFTAEGNFTEDLPLCPGGEKGPRCKTSCNEIGGNNDCKVLSACRKTGCACSQVLGGPDCTQPFDAPLNVVASSLGNGIVNLRWSHHRRTNGIIPKHHVEANPSSTDLRSYKSGESLIHYSNSIDVVHNHNEYSTQLNLLPSTVYEIRISIVTSGKKGPCSITAYSNRAALAFKHGTFEEVDRTHSTIVIHLPSVLNDTRGSTMHVIVKGLIPCEPHSELDTDLTKYANVSDGQFAWRAASFSNERKETFTIGDKATYGGAWNCALKPNETYEIVIVVQGGAKETENQTIAVSLPPIRLYAEPQKFNLVWLFLPAVTVFSVLLIIIGCRKREVTSKRCSKPVRNTATSGPECYEINEMYGKCI